MSSGDRDSAGKESVLGMGGGDGSTIARMYLMPLNCRLKKVKRHI